jgi:hypothetical protein
MYGNRTKNQEIDVYPLLHNHPKTKVQMNAKTRFINANMTEAPLNNPIIAAITAIPK